MKKKIIFLCICLTSGLWWGCSDFLEEYSQNASYIRTVDDLDELLLGEGYLSLEDNSFQILDLMSDESQERLVPSNSTSYTSTSTFANYRGFYGYLENPFTRLDGEVYNDYIWGEAYNRIAVLNSILEAKDELEVEKSADQERLNRVLGECLYLRAWNYFMLANLYGMPYDKTNLNDAGSVTLKIDAAVVDTKFGRDNTSTVYNQIVTDLLNSVELLEMGEGVYSKRHVTPAACYALLSRVYLYMEEYEKAVDAANQVEGYDLWNLVTMYSPGNGESFLTTACSELIFAQGTNSNLQGSSAIEIIEQDLWGWIMGGMVGPIPEIRTVSLFSDSYGCSEEIVELFDDTDVRFSAFFTRSWRNAYLKDRKYRIALAVGDTESEVETDPITNAKVIGSANGDPICGAASIRYAEVVLNKAEALACGGSTSEARVVIQDFCETRYVALPEIPTGQDALIRFIRQERQKELCFEGHRWFDLRRYAVNRVCPQKIAIKHELYMENNRQAFLAADVELAAYSESSKGAWILPAPEDVVDFCYPNFSNFDRRSGIKMTEYSN